MSAEPGAGQYQNTGREPATENIFDFLGFTEDNAQDAIVTRKVDDFRIACINRWQPGTGSVVYPTSATNSGYKATETIDASAIDDAVAKGQKTIIAAGCFVYKTIGSYHRSSFCYFFVKGKTKPAYWNICGTGNYAD